MRKTYRQALFLTFLLTAAIFISGCGKKKEPDAQSQQVLKITITPSVAPTKAPDEVNPDAVVKNGNMTMVNEYLDQKSSQNNPADTPSGSEAGTDSGQESTGGDESGGGDEEGTGGESE